VAERCCDFVYDECLDYGEEGESMIDLIFGIIGTIVNMITSVAFLPYENFSPIFIVLVFAFVLLTSAIKWLGGAIAWLGGIKRNKKA